MEREEPAKEKKEGAKKFYAVHKGRQTGIFTSWAEASKQVTGFRNACFKSFPTREKAENFLQQKHSPDSSLATLPSFPSEPTEPTEKPIRRERLSWKEYNKTRIIRTNSDPPRSLEVLFGEDDDNDEELINFGQLEPLEAGTYRQKYLVYTDGSYSRNTGGFSFIVLREEYLLLGTESPKQLGTESLKQLGTESLKQNLKQKPTLVKEKEEFGRLPDTYIKATNQRAELYAIVRALMYLETLPSLFNAEIRSDSQYSIKSITEWSENWIQNNWRTAAGGAVENRDLIENILTLRKRIEDKGHLLRFTHVRGHSGNEYGDLVDRLANFGRLSNY